MNTAQARLKGLSQQLLGSVTTQPEITPLQKVLAPSPDDVVITCALRTPLTKAGKGGLKDTLADDLLISILRVGDHVLLLCLFAGCDSCGESQ